MISPELSVSQTSFSGERPDSVSHLKSLSYLDLSRCKFSGPIPESHGNLTHITVLFLSSNNFSGHVPLTLANLELLTLFGISGNGFEGQIPDWFGNLTKLRHLLLGENSFNGQLILVPSLLFTLPSLEFILAGFNQLNGPIPQSISGLVNLTDLNLLSNNLSSNVSLGMFLRLKKLVTLDLSDSNLSLINKGSNATLPSSVEIALLSSCGITELDFLRTTTHLYHLEWFSNQLSVLDLQGNDFHGTIPTMFTKKSNRLRSFNLIETNWKEAFHDPWPIAPVWKFSTLETTSSMKLSQSSRFLSSSPINSMNFHSLRCESLSSPNEFTGLLPAIYFKSFRGMMNVNENSTRLMYMGDPEASYQDSITVVMKGMELVRILTVFATLDLSSNMFEGDIPDVIGDLNSLVVLNLSHNSLAGHIPSLLGAVSELESLDLSSNQLTGVIPEELTNLTFLALDVYLTYGSQFNTFRNDSYTGNSALCAVPLSLTCGDNETQKQPPLQQEDDSDFWSGFTWKAVFMGYGCGMVLGLLMGYLMFLTGKPILITGLVGGETRRKANRLDHIEYPSRIGFLHQLMSPYIHRKKQDEMQEMFVTGE
ncbi:hypothetical protein RJ639_046254, partial [Escallonia herrerae]